MNEKESLFLVIHYIIVYFTLLKHFIHFRSHRRCFSDFDALASQTHVAQMRMRPWRRRSWGRRNQSTRSCRDLLIGVTDQQPQSVIMQGASRWGVHWRLRNLASEETLWNFLAGFECFFPRTCLFPFAVEVMEKQLFPGLMSMSVLCCKGTNSMHVVFYSTSQCPVCTGWPHSVCACVFWQSKVPTSRTLSTQLQGRSSGS